MCYGNPVELLEKLLEANPLVPNHLGHTAQDDFEHFCAYSGLSEQTAGPGGFAWAKYAYFTNWPRARQPITA
jgi:hypothetical protein